MCMITKALERDDPVILSIQSNNQSIICGNFSKVSAANTALNILNEIGISEQLVHLLLLELEITGALKDDSNCGEEARSENNVINFTDFLKRGN